MRPWRWRAIKPDRLTEQLKRLKKRGQSLKSCFRPQLKNKSPQTEQKKQNQKSVPSWNNAIWYKHRVAGTGLKYLRRKKSN